MTCDFRFELNAQGKQNTPATLVQPYPVGKLQCTTVLGCGGMANVYQAYDALHRPFAVKQIHRSKSSKGRLLQTLQREAMILEHLSHPGLVQSYGIQLVDGEISHVMESIEGIHLDAYVRKHHLDSWNQLAILVEQLMDVLEYLHQNGLVYCDLKPSNILVVEGTVPQVKLIDFGAAQFQEQINPEMIFATPMFMAPEQAENPEKIDQRTDIYALARIVHTLCSSLNPHINSTLDLHWESPSTEDMPTELIENSCPNGVLDVLCWALNYNPSFRPDSITELRTALGFVPEERLVG